MKNLGSIPKNIRCAIGPCIGKESYEVGKDFYDKFIATDISNCQFFEKKTQKKDKYIFSLEGYVLNKLSILGVDNINSVGIDTYKEDHICFSYRKSLEKKENDYGRMISTIVIKD